MTAKQPKKVAVVGLDAAMPMRIRKYVDEGVLPNFARVIKGGVIAENCLVPMPTVTPPNWATLATGCWPGTHGVTDFHVWKPGNSLGMDGCHQGFNSFDCLTEPIWDIAEKAGKKCIVYNWPGSWPSNLKKGIMVGGNANIINDWRPPEMPANDAKFTVGSEMMFSTVMFAKGVEKIELGDAEGWTDLPKSSGKQPLEGEAKLNFRASAYEMGTNVLYFLVEDSQGKGYDRVTVSQTKKIKESLCTLKVGQWSQRIVTTFMTKNGEKKEVAFRCKLTELSKDGETLKLFMTGPGETSGFSNPPQIAKEISDHIKEGELGLRGGGLRAFGGGWIDLDTNREIHEFHAVFNGEAVEYLLKNKDWDCFFMQAHNPDWMYHSWLTSMDPVATKNEATNRLYQEAEKKVWIALDKMLGKIMDAAGPDALIALVSDHGSSADGYRLPLLEPLVENGLIKIEDEAGKAAMDLGTGEKSKSGEGWNLKEFYSLFMNAKMDWKNVKAIPQRGVHLFVNLKGRDPNGVVEPEDYDKVRQQIIDAYLSYVDPTTGKRPFAFALRKEDARPLGNYGEFCGDVVYGIYAWFGHQHGNVAPASEWGLGSMKGLFAMCGPGVKKNLVLKRTVWITDLVPTICFLADIPFPPMVEGAILFQALEDPDFKAKQMNELKEKLATMEAQLQGQK